MKWRILKICEEVGALDPPPPPPP
eukprot:SAG31_NODE_31692_length_365_cov_0.789474_1_plen_23_part_01